MGFSTVLIISLAAGVILIIGGGLMMYMANLVKSAYEIKVQINTEVEERLSKMGEDLDKKSRWIKRDLLEEIEKIKANMHTEAAAKVGELTQPFMAKLEQLETALKSERAEWVKAVDSDRAAIANLDNRVKSLSKQVKDDKPAPTTAPTPAGQATDQQPAPGPAPAPAPQPAAQPAKDTSAAWLPDLGAQAR